MASDCKFNMNGLFRIFSSTGNETLQLSAFNGIASIVIFRKNSENRRPLVKMNVSGAPSIKMRDILKSLMDAQPDTRMPFCQMNFNRETRNYEPATAFVFFKDEKRCYGIEVSNRSITTPIKFMFKCASTFTVSNSPMTDEEKSVLGVREFIDVLSNLTTACLMTRFNMEPPNRGGRGGSGNYNRNNGGGSRDQFNAPPAPSAGDEIFG